MVINRKVARASDFINCFPERARDSHKGTYGFTAVMGGCLEYSGAIKLANMSAAALKSGCGISRLIVPASIAHGVLPYILESTLATIPDREGHMIFDEPALVKALDKVQALALGMGWGTGPASGMGWDIGPAPARASGYADSRPGPDAAAHNHLILSYILKHYSIPLVIDADGLNTLSKSGLSILDDSRCSLILTPHPVEFQRLSGLPLSRILSSPAHCAESFASEHKVILLLKGADTVITDGSETFIVTRGCPGMATAGSGDVLSGILSGLLGYNPPTVRTVACGAYIAGIAGELAQADINQISTTASDTVAHIPAAISQILAETNC